jgi:hypothetical protein
MAFHRITEAVHGLDDRITEELSGLDEALPGLDDRIREALSIVWMAR